ncbi:exopolygalacturonase clone GBGA483-like [Mercurialis annua]|uniref:exopolygalacturonase clone GBGA483-like n=1 Tax=Mercurialis annua TaxID=3986 RepID=UPI00215F3BAD|nr:exopolygalacturonase clone GBGA483-like [Mercurialis annua]
MKGIGSFCIIILAILHAYNAEARVELTFESFASAYSPEETAYSPEAAAYSPVSDVESPGPSVSPYNGVFDVTQHGAVADGKTENSKAFLATWEAACGNAENSTFYIPKGTFLLGPILFLGPCYNDQSPKFKIEGTLLAPSAVKAFPDSDWVEFKNLNGLVITGGTGVTNFDGQGGVEAWRQPSCENSKACKLLVTSLKLNNVSYGTINGISMPSLVKLSNILFMNMIGSYKTDYAVTLLCSSSVPCDNIKIIGVNLNNSESNGSVSTQSRMDLKGVIKGLVVTNSTF